MKLLIILSLCLTLQACGITRMFSGETTKTVVVDQNGNIATNRFGQAVYNTSSKSKSAGIYDGAARMIEALPDETKTHQAPCGGLSFEQLAQLSPSAQSAFGNCLAAAEANKPFQIMGDALAMALTKYQSSAHAIAAEATNAVRAIQQGAVEKWNAVGNFGKFSIGVHSAQKYASNASRDRASVARAGAENAGDITANVQTGQYVSTSSTDGGNGAGGAGTGGMGSGTGGAGTGGAASVDNSLSSGGDTVIVGRGNTTYNIETNDNGSAFVDSTNGQILQPNADGAVNNDANIDQQPIISTLQDSTLENQPSNGNDNGL